jgi:hypothetical protein
VWRVFVACLRGSGTASAVLHVNLLDDDYIRSKHAVRRKNEHLR